MSREVGLGRVVVHLFGRPHAFSFACIPVSVPSVVSLLQVGKPAIILVP